MHTRYPWCVTNLQLYKSKYNFASNFIYCFLSYIQLSFITKKTNFNINILYSSYKYNITTQQLLKFRLHNIIIFQEIAVHVASRILAFPLYATRNHKGGCMSGTNKETQDWVGFAARNSEFVARSVKSHFTTARSDRQERERRRNNDGKSWLMRYREQRNR